MPRTRPSSRSQQQTGSQQQQLEQQKQLADQPAADPRLTDLENAIAKTAGIKSVSPAIVDKKGTAAAFTAIPTTGPSDTKTEDLVDKLRDDVIPKAVKGEDVTAYLGGQTAGYIDLANRISDKLPRMIGIVVLLSFFVLLLAFRSVLLPLKAALCNLLSVAAAYGVVTFIFQEGHGASLIGLDGPVPIVSYVPLLMFAILFGLSMDYEVFLLSQIQEHFELDGDTRKAVVDGLATTGRVITSAALIMVCVFSSFVLNGNVVVKQFGVGLAVAIAIDATLVSCLLVPAIMTLLGDSCWWIPRGSTRSCRTSASRAATSSATARCPARLRLRRLRRPPAVRPTAAEQRLGAAATPCRERLGRACAAHHVEAHRLLILSPACTTSSSAPPCSSSVRSCLSAAFQSANSESDGASGGVAVTIVIRSAPAARSALVAEPTAPSISLLPAADTSGRSPGIAREAATARLSGTPSA